MPLTPSPRLLIVDDEAAQMQALRDTLADEGYVTAGFTSAPEALAELRRQEFDLVITDLMMPGMDGIAFLREALEIDSDLVGVVMTAHGTIDTAVAAMQAGALDYILKPFKLSAIIPVLSRALAVRQLRVENIQLRETLGIYQLSTAIAFASGFGVILDRLADAAYQESEHGEAAVLLRGADDGELTVAAVRGNGSERLRNRRVCIDDAVTDWIARSHEAVSNPDIWNDPKFAYEHPFRDLTSGISLPMLSGGKLIGALIFASSRPHRAITPGQLKTLNILVGSAASALARAQLLDQLEERVAERTAQLEERNKQMEQELTMARELQIAMMPHRFPCVPRNAAPEQSAVRFFSLYRPAGSVSGDFFDVIPLADNSVGVFIGDVMGHDVSAALITAMMRALVQELGATLTDPGALLGELNRHLKAALKQADKVIFATASYLVFDLDRSQIVYANAGHPAPIQLHRSRGEAAPICSNGESGPALGLFEGTSYKTCHSTLCAGDCLILYTDGLVEVEAADGELYGEERLQNAISQKLEMSAEELLNTLFADARQFSGQQNFVDDICLVAVDVNEVGTCENWREVGPEIL